MDSHIEGWKAVRCAKEGGKDEKKKKDNVIELKRTEELQGQNERQNKMKKRCKEQTKVEAKEWKENTARERENEANGSSLWRMGLNQGEFPGD